MGASPGHSDCERWSSCNRVIFAKQPVPRFRKAALAVSNTTVHTESLHITPRARGLHPLVQEVCQPPRKGT